MIEKETGAGGVPIADHVHTRFEMSISSVNCADRVVLVPVTVLGDADTDVTMGPITFVRVAVPLSVPLTPVTVNGPPTPVAV